MPNWHEIHLQVKNEGSTFDVVRRRYLRALHKVTGRNVILYYSGWLQNSDAPVAVDDADKNGFMTVIHGLDRSKGLDLLLHTPGGDVAATESIVAYLRSMFGSDIRAIVPQLAMSAGTMISCSCKEIVMGKQSSLGPIDPQFGPFGAREIVEEFLRAHKEVKTDPAKQFVWGPILQKYHPALIGKCERAIKWSESLAEDWLKTGMFKGDNKTNDEVKKIVEDLSNHEEHCSHNRHLGVEKCKRIGLKVVDLEDDEDFQDAVLSVHHCCIQTLTESNAFKIIENHEGIAFIQAAHRVVIPKG